MRSSFPVFSKHPELIYLDSAATTQKLEVVYEAITAYYQEGVANPDRGLYRLSTEASQAIAESRKMIASFLGETNPASIIITSGATASINLVANGLRRSLQAGDEIILSDLEHHSNLLPWQLLAEEKNLILKFLPIDPATGKIIVGELQNLLTKRTKLIAVSHASNVFGACNPVQEIKKFLIQQGSDALVLVDASQTVANTPLSVKELGADFIVFSGHKMYAPAGVGVLWGTTPALAKLTPSQAGGGSVSTTSQQSPTWKDLPEKLEGGTMNTEGIICLALTCNFLQTTGWDAITGHYLAIASYARQKLATIPKLTFISPEDAQSIISFTIDGIHAHDIAQACADAGICIRAGQHCAGPLHATLNLSASCRISFALYTIPEDIDALVATLTELSAAYHA